MAVPKGFRTNINIINEKIGPDRRQEILDTITYKDTFLPKSVFEEDMDQSFIDFVSNDGGLSLSIDGEKVPVIFLTIQRWSEFTKTWQFTDEYKNIKIPFITIVRRPDIQQGQNQAGHWNIPGRRTYTYMKVPTWDGIRHGIDLYKIPQPTSVDLTYEVRLFSNRMKDLNKFNRIIQKSFQSRQSYINVNGHPMPLILDNIGDESNIDDIEQRRFYVQLFEIRLMGYIMDESDYEIIPTANRTIATFEVQESNNLINPDINITNNNNIVQFDFIWKPNTTNTLNYSLKYNVTFTGIFGIENINRIIIRKNNIVIFDGTILNNPLSFSSNDLLGVSIYKTPNSIGKFSLIGST